MNFADKSSNIYNTPPVPIMPLLPHNALSSRRIIFTIPQTTCGPHTKPVFCTTLLLLQTTFLPIKPRCVC